MPRFEYGLTTPVLSHIDGGVLAVGSPVTLVLSTAADLDVADGRDRAYGITSLTEGDQIALAVEHGSSWEPPPPILGADEICGMLDDTSQAWRSWEAEHQRYGGAFADEVDLAGRVLQGPTYVPTGAIVAAPTTSLPETIGGGRSWDYCYSWVRDSFTLDALWVAACLP